jgi:hypothetical protein
MVVDDGIVFCLDFGSRRCYTSGTTANDLAGSNNGVLTNGPIFSDENSGQIIFDGTNDEIRMVDLDVTLYTVNIWLKFNYEVNNASANRGIFRYKNLSDTTQGSLSTGSITGHYDGEVLTIMNSIYSGSGYTRTVTEDTIPAGWHNICLRWNGTNYEYYINGSKVNEYPSTQGGHAPLITTDGIFIGENYTVGNQNFLGSIGVFSVYDRPLTAEEIRQNYIATRGRFQ